MIGSYAPTRRLFSSFTNRTTRSSMREAQEPAADRFLVPGPAVKESFEVSSESHRSTTRSLLNYSDGQALLATGADSLETIADVLIEMKSLADAAAANPNQPISASVANGPRGLWNWINGNRRASSERSSTRTAVRDRLAELAQEIDDIVLDTTYAGMQLLGASRPSTDFRVNLSHDETLEISFESISAAGLSVAAYELGTYDDEQLRKTQERIGLALSRVQSQLRSVTASKERLDAAYEGRTLERRVHHTASMEVKNAISAREQLERAKLRITDESHHALLAQANATSDSTLRLIEALFENDDEAPFARIYSLDHDRDNAPVTPLRRIMLGNDSEASEYVASSKRGA